MSVLDLLRQRVRSSPDGIDSVRDGGFRRSPASTRGQSLNVGDRCRPWTCSTGAGGSSGRCTARRDGPLRLGGGERRRARPWRRRGGPDVAEVPLRDARRREQDMWTSGRPVNLTAAAADGPGDLQVLPGHRPGGARRSTRSTARSSRAPAPRVREAAARPEEKPSGRADQAQSGTEAYEPPPPEPVDQQGAAGAEEDLPERVDRDDGLDPTKILRSAP